MTRRCVLSMERKALMIQLAISDSQVLNPTENILTVEELTHALQKNAAADHQIFYKTAKAVHRGVSMQDNHIVLKTEFGRPMLCCTSCWLTHVPGCFLSCQSCRASSPTL